MRIFRSLRVRPRLPAVAGLALLALIACDGNKSPTSPNGGNRVVTGVALTPGTDFLKIGESATFAMEATYSDGTREPMTAVTWGCDNPAVANITSGRVTAVGSGRATVFGDCPHGRATRLLRITPDYDGEWAGQYRWRSCRASGELERERICAEMPVGMEAPIALQASQDRDRIAGKLHLGELSGDVTGEIDVPGNLRLNGNLRFDEDGIVINIALQEWDSLVNEDRMTGAFRLVWTVVGVPGEMVIDCEITSVGRGAAAARAVRSSRRGGVKSGLPALIRSVIGVS
jgi:hypothetical protein